VPVLRLTDNGRVGTTESGIAGIEGARGIAIEQHRTIGSVAADWDALADRTSAPPFLRPGWFEAWLGAFGGSPCILAVRREGVLAGVLPLVRRLGSLRSATNWHTPLFEPIADGDSALGALAAAALSQRASRLDLAFLEPQGPGAAALRSAAAAAGSRTVERTIARQPYVHLDGDWDAYEQGMQRKQRKELRRVRRRLEEEGEVGVELTRPDGEPGALLGEGLAIEGSGWKDERGTAIASEPAVERFYRSVAAWAAGRGELVLAFLRLDGRALAFDLCLESEGALYVLKGGFDPAYRRFAPGALLTYESLAVAFERGLGSYEFLGTDDAYKLAWSHGTRERVRLQVFPRTPAGALERLAWTHGRSAARWALARAGR
jgi:CelD/BcsL family acetyltransferase involved in cellulose biosynthesis